MSAFKSYIIMDEQAVQPKKNFWKTLGKIVAVLLPVGIAVAKQLKSEDKGGFVASAASTLDADKILQEGKDINY